jgi:hypothetical protein
MAQKCLFGWAVVGAGGKALVSTNAVDWSASSGVVGADTPSSVAFGRGVFVAVGSAGGSCSGSGHTLVSISPDGLNWSTPSDATDTQPLSDLYPTRAPAAK